MIPRPHAPPLRGLALALGLLLAGSAPHSASAAVRPPEEGTLAYASAQELQAALTAGTLTATELLTHLKARIATLNEAGPTLRAVHALNPEAGAAAAASDRHRRESAPRLLEGLPVLVKDNIETRDPLPTTAGSTALLDNFAEADSPVVAALRAQGAIILGKTNLSQWANFRSNDSISGWSAVGGQVRNPHVLDRSPCGSSSGSGAAVAAGFAPLALGTETNGSIICPAQVNGIVGFKPTHGLLSTAGIVPLAASQDTAGPMTRTVADAALMMDAMVPGGTYREALKAGLTGKRVVVAQFAAGTDPRILAHFEAAQRLLEAAGAELIVLDTFERPLQALGADSLYVLEAEFRDGIKAYLARAQGAFRGKTLADLIAYNRREASRELARFDQSLFEEAEALGPRDRTRYEAARLRLKTAAGTDTLDALLDAHDAQLILAPSGPLTPPVDMVNGDLWPRWLGLGGEAAVAGYPHLTVPLARIDALPLGLSFIGRAGDDGGVLAAGAAFETRRGPLPLPAFHPTAPVSWGPP